MAYYIEGLARTKKLPSINQLLGVEVAKETINRKRNNLDERLKAAFSTLPKKMMKREKA